MVCILQSYFRAYQCELIHFEFDVNSKSTIRMYYWQLCVCVSLNIIKGTLFIPVALIPLKTVL